jgi:PilZ domain-containing protein
MTIVEATNQQLTLAGIETSAILLNRFAECFEEFRIKLQTLSLPCRDAGSCTRFGEKVYGCVLPLTDAAFNSLKKADWFVPRKTVIYGLGNAHEAWRFGHLSMNVLVQSRSLAAIHAAVDATQSLILRGIGQCGRVPIALPVVVKNNGRAVRGVTRNVGSGGMAVDLLRKTDLPRRVTLSFVLPGVAPLNRTASPRWYSGNLVGLHFDSPEKDVVLERWVQEYSGLGT